MTTPNQARDELVAHLNTHMVPGTSGLVTIFPYRHFTTDIAAYGTLTITRFTINRFATELRFSLSVIFLHDGSPAGLEAAEASLILAADDFQSAIRATDNPAAFTHIKKLHQIAQATAPPSPKYHPDLRWLFIPIQLETITG